MTTSLIAAMLERHEGRKSKMYLDSMGIPTIGCGRNLRDRGLLPEEIDFLRDNDILDCARDLKALFGDTWNGMGEVRRSALTDMRFQLGADGFRQFRKMIACVLAGEWGSAATEALDSAWAKQVPGRAEEVTGMLRTGEAPEWWESEKAARD